MNRRYRTIEYGLKRLFATEVVIQKRLDRRNNHPRYERSIPGELLHGDTKRLPSIRGLPARRMRREVLFVAIDDNSRFAAADILPDKTSESASVFLENTLPRLPFKVDCHYSDNGGEYKGGSDHVFMATCKRFGLSQRFTQPYHPWTNGKAERFIKTIIYDWLRKNTFKSYEERRVSLYKFIDEYNHTRPHMSLGGKTPSERLSSYLVETGDNAC
jgi:transposase InsO family protein